MQAFHLLETIKDAYSDILGDTLIGFYVHGSLAFGCFSWARSDLDFLVVVTTAPTQEQKCALIRVLLDADKKAPQKGFEMSVVTADAVNPFVYPTPYVLHYSGTYRDACRRDLHTYCRDMHGTDPDLAAHITVCHAAGITLCGKPIGKVFGAVPASAYLDSIRSDIENASQDIRENPVYVILNLCRVLGYLREGLVLSKADGGKWGIVHLPKVYTPLISSALAYYTDGVPFDCDTEIGQRFAEEMVNEIFR